MANICDNRFILHCDNNYNKYLNKFEDLFENNLEGDITWGSTPDKDYNGEGSFEGFFESRWVFPLDLISKILENSSKEDNVYFRCLSEEYGTGYVAMNIYEDNEWRDEQCFDI